MHVSLTYIYLHLPEFSEIFHLIIVYLWTFVIFWHLVLAHFLPESRNRYEYLFCRCNVIKSSVLPVKQLGASCASHSTISHKKCKRETALGGGTHPPPQPERMRRLSREGKKWNSTTMYYRFSILAGVFCLPIQVYYGRNPLPDYRRLALLRGYDIQEINAINMTSCHLLISECRQSDTTTHPSTQQATYCWWDSMI